MIAVTKWLLKLKPKLKKMLPVSDLPTSNHSLYGLQNSGKAGWATSVLKSKLSRFSEVLTLYTNSDISKTNYT